MTLKLPQTLSVEDYLSFEQQSDKRYEYAYGYIYAMAGSTVEHNEIITNIQNRLLSSARQQNCALYSENVKLQAADEVFYYPDLMLLCSKAVKGTYIVQHPCVIIEVLSENSLRKDRLEKLLIYRTIANLKLYLLVDSRQEAVIG
ncbi:MAG: Uma2 family endonuclease, partial [Deinococcales bacterium]